MRRWVLLLFHVTSVSTCSWHSGCPRLDQITQQVAKNGWQILWGKAKFTRMHGSVLWWAVTSRLLAVSQRMAAGSGRLKNLNLSRRNFCWNGRHRRWMLVVVVRFGRCSSETHVWGLGFAMDDDAQQFSKGTKIKAESSVSCVCLFEVCASKEKRKKWR